MNQHVEAVYTNGAFVPLQRVELTEGERGRLVVEVVEEFSPEERVAALKAFCERANRMGFRSTGPYPTRGELHER